MSAIAAILASEVSKALKRKRKYNRISSTKSLAEKMEELDRLYFIPRDYRKGTVNRVALLFLSAILAFVISTILLVCSQYERFTDEIFPIYLVSGFTFSFILLWMLPPIFKKFNLFLNPYYKKYKHLYCKSELLRCLIKYSDILLYIEFESFIIKMGVQPQITETKRNNIIIKQYEWKDDFIHIKIIIPNLDSNFITVESIN